MDDESWLEPEQTTDDISDQERRELEDEQASITEEQRQAQEDAAIEQIVTERQLEKEIQPVGLTKPIVVFSKLISAFK